MGRAMPNHAAVHTDPQRAAALLAWSLAVGLIVVTWGPQEIRPRISNPDVERFGAYFLTAAMFVAAYPKRALTIALASVVFAVALELGQFLAPGRDPHVSDAIVKSLGGLCGAGATHLGLRARRL